MLVIQSIVLFVYAIASLTAVVRHIDVGLPTWVRHRIADAAPVLERSMVYATSFYAVYDALHTLQSDNGTSLITISGGKLLINNRQIGPFIPAVPTNIPASVDVDAPHFVAADVSALNTTDIFNGPEDREESKAEAEEEPLNGGNERDGKTDDHYFLGRRDDEWEWVSLYTVSRIINAERRKMQGNSLLDSDDYKDLAQSVVDVGSRYTADHEVEGSSVFHFIIVCLSVLGFVLYSRRTTQDTVRPIRLRAMDDHLEDREPRHDLAQGIVDTGSSEISSVPNENIRPTTLGPVEPDAAVVKETTETEEETEVIKADESAEIQQNSEPELGGDSDAPVMVCSLNASIDPEDSLAPPLDTAELDKDDPEYKKYLALFIEKWGPCDTAEPDESDAKPAKEGRGLLDSWWAPGGTAEPDEGDTKPAKVDRGLLGSRCAPRDTAEPDEGDPKPAKVDRGLLDSSGAPRDTAEPDEGDPKPAKVDRGLLDSSRAPRDTAEPDEGDPKPAKVDRGLLDSSRAPRDTAEPDEGDPKPAKVDRGLLDSSRAPRDTAEPDEGDPKPAKVGRGLLDSRWAPRDTAEPDEGDTKTAEEDHGQRASAPTLDTAERNKGNLKTTEEDPGVDTSTRAPSPTQDGAAFDISTGPFPDYSGRGLETSIWAPGAQLRAGSTTAEDISTVIDRANSDQNAGSSAPNKKKRTNRKSGRK